MSSTYINTAATGSTLDVWVDTSVRKASVGDTHQLVLKGWINFIIWARSLKTVHEKQLWDSNSWNSKWVGAYGIKYAKEKGKNTSFGKDNYHYHYHYQTIITHSITWTLALCQSPCQMPLCIIYSHNMGGMVVWAKLYSSHISLASYNAFFSLT